MSYEQHSLANVRKKGMTKVDCFNGVDVYFDVESGGFLADYRARVPGRSWISNRTYRGICAALIRAGVTGDKPVDAAKVMINSGYWSDGNLVPAQLTGRTRRRAGYTHGLQYEVRVQEKKGVELKWFGADDVFKHDLRFARALKAAVVAEKRTESHRVALEKKKKRFFTSREEK